MEESEHYENTIDSFRKAHGQNPEAARKECRKSAGLCPLDTHKTPLCQSIYCRLPYYRRYWYKRKNIRHQLCGTTL